MTGRDSKGILLAWESLPDPEQLVPMKIDIDTLTEAELIDLNHRIVAR
ncbi:MAG: hypothetical protein JOY71_28440, partial [Acetobacteraceae bacterium]|nr:hypothetical protein [Acetobacteraceae bacterium]